MRCWSTAGSPAWEPPGAQMWTRGKREGSRAGNSPDGLDFSMVDGYRGLCPPTWAGPRGGAMRCGQGQAQEPAQAQTLPSPGNAHRSQLSSSRGPPAGTATRQPRPPRYTNGWEPTCCLLLVRYQACDHGGPPPPMAPCTYGETRVKGAGESAVEAAHAESLVTSSPAA